jgi:hypothetical protein
MIYLGCLASIAKLIRVKAATWIALLIQNVKQANNSNASSIMETVIVKG